VTIREREFVLTEEIDQIIAERGELAETVAEMDDDNAKRQQKAQRGLELDAYLDGLEWAQTAHEDDDFPQWDEDGDSVTLAGLTGGEFGEIEGEVSDGVDRGQSAQQVERVAKVRIGTVDAPYLSGQASDTQEIAAVAGLPIGFLRWAGAQVEDLSSVGNDERSDFGTLLAEKSEDT